MSNATYFYSVYIFQSYFGVLSLEPSLCCALNTDGFSSVFRVFVDVGVCQMDELLWNADVDLLEADSAGIC